MYFDKLQVSKIISCPTSTLYWTSNVYLQKSLHVVRENENNLTLCVNTRLDFIQLVANTCFLVHTGMKGTEKAY